MSTPYRLECSTSAIKGSTVTMRDPLLWAACVVYAVLFTVLGWVKYQTHHNLVDFGIFAQTTASAFGCFCNSIEGSHWAYHFSPILYVAGAFVVLWKSPLVLIIAQSAACALVAPPIYAIVRARTSIIPARLAAFVALLYPPLAGLSFVDFHENALAPAAIAWLLWAFDSGYFGVGAIAAAIALAVKEDQAIFLAVAGVVGGIFYRSTKQRFAIGVATVAILVACIFFFIIQPHAATSSATSATSPWHPTRFYNWTADDIHRLFFRGLLERIGFIALAFLPLLFLPFRSRWAILAILPLAEVLLSTMSTTYTLGTHYAGAWIGYIMVAFAMAVREIQPLRKAQTLLTWCLALCIVSFIVANPLHPKLNLGTRQPRDNALDAFLVQLPHHASIATQEEAYTHLALTDPEATVLPEFSSIPIPACYALIDTDFPNSPRLQEYGATLLANRTYARIRQSGNIQLFRSRRCSP